MNQILVLIAAKFIAYALWSWAGMAWLRGSRPAFGKSFLEIGGLGMLRVMLGVAFGTGVFLFSMGSDLHGTLGEYIGVYAPVRFLEWAILAYIIRRRALHAGNEDPDSPDQPSAALLSDSSRWRVLIWIAVGILISFLVDSFSPVGIKDHFCTGRCLC